MTTKADEILYGLLSRRPRWGFSGRGWVLLGFLAVVALFIFAVSVHSFFSVTNRVDSRYLVVEGWISDEAVREAADEIKRGDYARVFSTGGPLQGLGAYVSDMMTAASWGSIRLTRTGVPEALIQIVPAGPHARDRTYGAASALSEWLQRNEPTIKTINVLTADVHARRTRLLYQKALGDIKVGIISVPNSDYEASRWWRYSQGVRSVLGECIAYTYARVFFHPDAPAAARADTRAATTRAI